MTGVFPLCLDDMAPASGLSHLCGLLADTPLLTWAREVFDLSTAHERRSRYSL